MREGTKDRDIERLDSQNTLSNQNDRKTKVLCAPSSGLIWKGFVEDYKDK